MSYSTPGGIKSKSYTVTSADVLNAVPLEMDGISLISGSILSGAQYDGTIDLQIQYDDGTWHSIFFGLGPNTTVKVLCSNYIGSGSGNFLINANVKFPYNIRVLVTVKATQGSITVKFNTF